MTFETLESLQWVGRAWPAATITGPIRVVVKGATGSEKRGTALEIATTGQGRNYDLWGPMSFWRSFAEIDLSDTYAVLAFVRRRGDPFGILSPDTPSDTSSWQDLIELLKPAAACWMLAPPSPGSRYAGLPDFPDDFSMLNKRARHEARERLIGSPLLSELSLRPIMRRRKVAQQYLESRLEIGIVPASLAAFMWASALSDFDGSRPMARCRHCREWFGVDRIDAMFCSASCRALHSTAKKGQKINGKRPAPGRGLDR